MASTTIIPPVAGARAPAIRPRQLPAVPWRDPHSISPQKLAEVIASLEEACLQNPASADLRTLLGIAHAMNYDAYRSMDALEHAREIEPQNFFAQFKYAELVYRLRALERAEEETLCALELAANGWELEQARRQLSEIRRLRREGTQKPSWTKSLKVPALGLGLLLTVVALLFLVSR